MDVIEIFGGKPLKGKIRISGSKNSALQILASTLLTNSIVMLNNIPSLSDIFSMIDLLKSLNVTIYKKKNSCYTFKSKKPESLIAPYELVRKMKLEEERIAQEKKLSELISKLPSGILVTFDGTDHFRLTDEVYEQVCKATKLIPQRAIMGANFLNFRAHEIYTINGNKIDETFVKWDEEKNKCFAGFTVSGNNVGVDESITVSGEALSFLSTGIDTRVYYIKNF